MISFDKKLQILKLSYQSFFKINKDKLLPINLNIILNNECNLYCSDCQNFCNINNKNLNTTTLNDLKNFLPKIKKFFKIQDIILLGGEPLLHKNLFDICKFLRNIFKKNKIIIVTNGLNFKDLNYDKFLKLNINFEFSLYPDLSLIKNFKQIKNKNLKNVSIKNIRPTFIKTTFNPKGDENIDKFFICNGANKSFPFNLFIFQDKLFKCPFPINWNVINLPLSEKDYLNLNYFSKNDIINFLSNGTPSCKYCGNQEIDKDLFYESDDIILWHQQKDLPNDYFHNLLWYYLYDYAKYYIYCHDCSQIIQVLKDPFYLSLSKNEFYLDMSIKCLYNRFFTGEKDIFIPFTKNISFKDIISLKDQIFTMKDFYKINFYFVSIDKDNMAKKEMYKNFLPFCSTTKGNFFFLEALGLQNGYQEFLNNSYLNIKDSILLLNI